MLAAVGSAFPVTGPAPLERGAEDAARQSRPPSRPEPPISPPAVILPRTAAWLSQGEAASEPPPAQVPTLLLQTA